jgi:hypothetical protein
MGRILTPARGRVLLRHAPQPTQQRSGSTAWRTLTLLCALPLFAQCFQYMVDIMPLYLLSKAWPILVLPLCVWAMVALDVPHRLLYVATLFWILGVTPFVGIVTLGNGVAAAIETTAKVWSYTYVFSLAGLLVLLRPERKALRRLLIGLGGGTYVVMLLLWLTVPTRNYGGGDAVTKLFMYDPERGYHIYMPMFFGTLLIFMLNRSFWWRPKVWKLVGLAVAFVLLVEIDKERATTAAAAVTVAFGATAHMGRWRKAVYAAMAVGVAAAGLLALQHMTAATGLSSNFGGSLKVRTTSVTTAWNYLSADPLRWLLGVGATTRFGNVTLGGLFGNAMFFLADIGWLGVIFEYGAIGALLLLLVHLAGLRQARRWEQPDDPLSQALGDYIVYLIIESAVYSVVSTPGELTTVMALSYYFARQPRQLPDYGGQSQLPKFRPRQSAIAKLRPSGAVALPRPPGGANRG